MSTPTDGAPDPQRHARDHSTPDRSTTSGESALTGALGTGTTGRRYTGWRRLFQLAGVAGAVIVLALLTSGASAIAFGAAIVGLVILAEVATAYL